MAGPGAAVKITLNGESYETPGKATIADLLAGLDIDPRRVAVEHNLVVLKRAAFETTELEDGDEVEIVNFVGGG
jgi:thiamine biosynthesis protein ThiS